MPAEPALPTTSPSRSLAGSSKQTAVADKKARKRELDRICQRRKRKKDRDLIDRLQARINDLQHQADNGHLNSLLLDRENRQALAERHCERMRKVQALIKEDLDDAANKDGESADSESEETSPAETHDKPALLLNGHHEFAVPLETIHVPDHSHEVSSASLPGESLLDVNYGPLPVGQDLGIDLISPARPPYATSSFSRPESNLDGTDTSRHDGTGLPFGSTCGECETHWTHTNDILLRARRSQFNTWPPEYDLDASIIVVAVTAGWEQAQRHFNLDPLWECLRLVDEINFAPISGRIERIATLRILRNLLKCQVAPAVYNGEPIPQFYKPRPSQLNVKHPAVADYFVWPSFREHVVFKHGNLCKNAFSRMFSMSFRFLWPFEIRDAYTRNTETGLLSFSSTFTKRMADIRCWAMARDFVTAYPEFEGDVPIYEPRPAQLSLGMTRFEKEKYVRQHALTHSNAEDEVADEEVLRQEPLFNLGDWLGSMG